MEPMCSGRYFEYGMSIRSCALARRGMGQYDTRCLPREKEQFSMMNLRSIVLLTALAISAPSLAAAADWPNRPIHFIVPFPAGGSTDVAARLVGDYLSRTFGQQVVVENKSGAN